MQSFFTERDLAEKIFSKRPILGEILQNHGHKTLSEYSSEFYNRNPEISLEKQTEFITTLAAEITRVFGFETGQRVSRQIFENYFVSTTDHLGPLGSPFFVGANLLAGISNDFSGGKNLSDWVVLACSNVSLNNSSFPRGLKFHVQKNGILEERAFSFFGSKARHQPVFNSAAYSAEKNLEFYEFLKNSFDDS